jgi:hypothetical protein
VRLLVEESGVIIAWRVSNLKQKVMKVEALLANSAEPRASTDLARTMIKINLFM